MSRAAKLAMQIESEMRRSYLRYDQILFWPALFAEAGMGSDREIKAALGVLVVAEKIRLEIAVRCLMGHDLWVGPADAVPDYVEECMQCSEPGDHGDGGEYLSLHLTETWRKLLDRESSNTEKKSPMTVL